MPLTIDTSPRTIQRHRTHTPGPARDALPDPLTDPLPATEWEPGSAAPTAEAAPEQFAAEPAEPSYGAAPAWTETDDWAADTWTDAHAEAPEESPAEPPTDQGERQELREQRWTDSWSDHWVEDEPTPVPAPRPVLPATPLVGGGPAVPPTRTIALFPPIRAGGGRHRLPAPVRRRPGPIAAGLMVAATTLAAGSLRGPLTTTGGAHAAARAPLAVHSPDDWGHSFE